MSWGTRNGDGAAAQSDTRGNVSDVEADRLCEVSERNNPEPRLRPVTCKDRVEEN